MQGFGDYRQKYYIIFTLICLFIYFKLYSRTDKAKKTQLLSSVVKMNHEHDHAAMVASSTPSIHQDHLNGTHTVGNVHGLGMMMIMTFHGGYKETILFDPWATKTVGGFVGSWFVIFLIAAFYEALKTFRDILAQRCSCNTHSQTQTNSRVIDRLLNITHTIQTLLHIIQMTISYFLMLVAMTYNSYLVLAVILGAGFGHFLFAWRRSFVLAHSEHCH